MCKLSDDQVIMTAVFTYSVHVCIYLQFAMNEKKKSQIKSFLYGFNLYNIIHSN